MVKNVVKTASLKSRQLLARSRKRFSLCHCSLQSSIIQVISVFKTCTAINKEKNILFLILFLTLDYGYVGKTALVFDASSQVVVTAVNSTGTTLALNIIMAMLGFDFITADIAANSIFDNQYKSSFVKSSCIKCAP